MSQEVLLAYMKYNVEGSWPALVTPFTGKDEVNLVELRRLVDFHKENNRSRPQQAAAPGSRFSPGLCKENRRPIVWAEDFMKSH